MVGVCRKGKWWLLSIFSAMLRANYFAAVCPVEESKKSAWLSGLSRPLATSGHPSAAVLAEAHETVVPVYRQSMG